MTNPPNTQQLLPEAVRRRLDPLMLVANKIRAGAMKGERRSIKRGTSIEFADYRNYSPGDDLRKLDWNVYARLERPYIKLLEDEEDLAVHLLLDMSGSMAWPRDEESGDLAHNKLLFAQKIAAGLAYISLSTGDRLTINALSESRLPMYGPTRGRAQSVAMLRYLNSLKASGQTDLNHTLRQFALRERRPGLVVILSDLFSPAGYLDGLNRVLSKGHEVAIVHILSPDEIAPPLGGDLRLVDVETDRPQEVTIDATMRTIYEHRLQSWLDELRDTCGRRGVHYVLAQSDMPPERVILYDLRRLGLVK